MDLAGYIILIIGVSNSVGLTLAKIIHNYGGTVIGTYYNQKIEEEYETYYLNVTNEEEVKSFFEKIKDKHEKIDAVIDLASLSIDNDLTHKTLEEFMNVVNVNLGGTFLVNKYASLFMDKGVIVNMASTDGVDTYNSLNMDYSASKAGVINLTQNLANSLPNLRICGIAPNWIDTSKTKEMMPSYLQAEMKRINQERLLTKEEVALKILEIIVNTDISSGSIIRMSGKNE